MTSKLIVKGERLGMEAGTAPTYELGLCSLRSADLEFLALPTAKTHGLLYGPNSNGNFYIAMYYHRATRNPNKDLWDPTFGVDEEYGLFNLADTHNWCCSEGHKWGILNDGRRKLGTKGQRISFCPNKHNADDPWHGYPVSTTSLDYEVPEDVLDIWEDNNVITKITARRIRSAKL